MAKIVVKLHGKEVSTLQLHDGQEYLAGRGADSAILLDGHKGISRQHLKFFQQDGTWVVALLARFGSVIKDGESYEALPLPGDCVFSVPPYEFHFILNEPSTMAIPDAPFDFSGEAGNTKMPTVRTQALPPDKPASGTKTQPLPQANSDATVAGTSTLVPFLKISNSNNQQEEILRLEGHLWVAGRDPSCEIQIDDGRASRRHFELVHTNEGFFITDLGSANGTLLNEEALPPNEAYQLASGDTIRISNISVHFEVRDTGFQNKLATVGQLPPPVAPAGPLTPVGSAPMNGELDLENPGPLTYPQLPGTGAVRLQGNQITQWNGPTAPGDEPPAGGLGKKLVRVAIVGLAGLIVYSVLFDGQPTKPVEPSKDSMDLNSRSLTFDQLKPEQQRAVKDSFALAHTMYIQSKYELCLAELKKLHEIVPAYDESKDLANRCENGAANILKIRDRERLQQEEAENQRVINMIVEDCRRQMNIRTTLEQIRLCLAQAIERSPEHPGVRELEQIARDRDEQRKRAQNEAESIRQRRANGQRHYERARALYKSGDLNKAMAEFEKFIDANYPGMESEKSEAQRNVASVKKQLSEKISSLLQTCKESIDKSQFKAAYINCDKVLKDDPSNASAKQMKMQALAEMRKELKSMYEDSVLEESMGNIDSAKEKWKQIIDKSVPGDEYYNKAKRNLDKYGQTL